MPIVTIKNSGQTINVSAGTILLDALLDAGLPMASSCHGEGICGMCRVQIVSAEAVLPAYNTAEQQFVDKNQLDNEQRISCQLTVECDLTVTTTYW